MVLASNPIIREEMREAEETRWQNHRRCKGRALLGKREWACFICVLVFLPIFGAAAFIGQIVIEAKLVPESPGFGMLSFIGLAFFLITILVDTFFLCALLWTPCMVCCGDCDTVLKSTSPN